MPKINIDHNSTLPAADSYQKLKEFFDKDSDIHRIDPKIKCAYDDQTRKGKITGSQFKGEVAVEERGTGSVIKVMIDLPLLLTPLKGKVEETLQKKLKKYLA